MVSTSTTWCILVDESIKKIPDLYNLVQQKFKLVFSEDFCQNTDQYGHNIDAICWVHDLPCARDESFINKMPNLRVLFSCGIGTDHLNLPMLWKKGIRVATCTAGNSVACNAAELGFALMMISARNLKLAMAAYQDNMDIMTFRGKHSGIRLLGSTLGIVGMGTIGYMIAERAAAFKMNILYHNRKPRSNADEAPVQATYCDTIDKLLIQSDFVMLCVQLTNDTRGMIGAKELKMMKSTAILINIARGDVVDQDALTKALQENTIGGAALDVTTPEPLPPDHPLLHMPNVIVTPHYGGATTATGKEIGQILLDNLSAGLEGKAMPQELKPIE